MRMHLVVVAAIVAFGVTTSVDARPLASTIDPTTQPTTPQPPTPQPPTPQPPPTDPPATAPPATAPPVTEPPSTEPGSTEPASPPAPNPDPPAAAAPEPSDPISVPVSTAPSESEAATSTTTSTTLVEPVDCPTGSFASNHNPPSDWGGGDQQRFDGRAPAIGRVDGAATAPVPWSGGGDVAFPVLGPVWYVNNFGDPRDGGTRCHHGIDMFGVRMQPILAPASGTVVEITRGGNPGNGVIIHDGTYAYQLFHFERVAPGITSGSPVVAGQVVGYMGASGNAGGSLVHLHFEVRSGDRAVSPFRMLEAASERQMCTLGLGPASAVVTGRPDEDTSRVVVSSVSGQGSWTIDSAGRVTAVGAAALITPTSGCAPSDIVYGTDASG